MFILIGEFEGDYGDFYQRPVEAIACSDSEDKLKTYWKLIKDNSEYVDFRIEEVLNLDTKNNNEQNL